MGQSTIPKSSSFSKTPFLSDALLCSTSQPFNHIYDKYDLISQDNQKRLSVLKQKQSSNVYILKQLVFSEHKQYLNRIKVFQNMRELFCSQQYQHFYQNILNLNKVWTQEHNTFCSNTYKIYALYQYSLITLKDQIQARKIENKSFLQQQLLGIIQAAINSLHCQIPILFSQKQIFISEEGLLKVNNWQLSSTNDAYQNYLEGTYYAPQKMQLFYSHKNQQNGSSSRLNFKNSNIKVQFDNQIQIPLSQSIFSLGMMILKIIYQLQWDVDIFSNLYDPLNKNKKQRFNLNKLKQLINKLDLTDNEQRLITQEEIQNQEQKSQKSQKQSSCKESIQEHLFEISQSTQQKQIKQNLSQDTKKGGILSQKFTNLLKHMLAINPSKRPNLQQLQIFLDQCAKQINFQNKSNIRLTQTIKNCQLVSSKQYQEQSLSINYDKIIKNDFRKLGGASSKRIKKYDENKLNQKKITIKIQDKIQQVQPPSNNTTNNTTPFYPLSPIHAHNLTRTFVSIPSSTLNPSKQHLQQNAVMIQKNNVIKPLSINSKNQNSKNHQNEQQSIMEIDALIKQVNISQSVNSTYINNLNTSYNYNSYHLSQYKSTLSQQSINPLLQLPCPIDKNNPLFTSPQFLLKINQDIKKFTTVPNYKVE